MDLSIWYDLEIFHVMLMPVLKSLRNIQLMFLRRFFFKKNQWCSEIMMARGDGNIIYRRKIRISKSGKDKKRKICLENVAF